MAAPIMVCCLCDDSLPSNHRKRKRIESCPQAVSALKKLGNELGIGDVLPTSKWFCINCERQLTKINSLEEQLSTLRSCIVKKIDENR